MDLNIVRVALKSSGDFAMKNSPTILTALAVTGVFSTGYLAAKATGPALEIIDAEKMQREMNAVTTGFEELPMTFFDYVRLTWKLYAPAVAVALATTGCIVGANTINIRRQAALASLYGIADTALKEYQQKTIETLGEKKEAKMREEMQQETLDRHPVEQKQIIITGRGNALFYDPLSDRYFLSTIDQVERAVNRFNHLVINEEPMSLNEFYDQIGLPHCEVGDTLGWAANEHLVEINYTTKLAKSMDQNVNDQPCVVLNFRFKPRPI